MKTRYALNIGLTLMILAAACSESQSVSEPVASQEQPAAAPLQASNGLAYTSSDFTDFFNGVHNELGFAPNEFAIQALNVWAEDGENTRAQWNPLATTWDMLKKSSEFNNAGVQNYVDQNTGIEATAKTLARSDYDAIRAMLNEGAFDRQQIVKALNTWSGNGGYVPRIVDEWEILYERSTRRNAASLPAKKILDIFCGQETPEMSLNGLVLCRPSAKVGHFWT